MKGNWHFILLIAIVSAISAWESFPLVVVFLIVTLFLFFYIQSKTTSFLIIVSVVTFLVFYIRISLIQVAPELLMNEQQYLSGEIITYPEQNDTHFSFILKDLESKQKTHVTLNQSELTSDLLPQFKLGANCTLTGEFFQFTAARNPGEFDYKGYMKARGVNSGFSISKLTGNVCKGEKLINKIYETREKQLNKIKEKYQPKTAQWIFALVFGERNTLDKNVLELFQRWNLSHLLAISGLHVGLFIGAVYWFLVRVLGFTLERTKLILMFIIPVYGIVGGGAPPVWRAVGMAELAILLMFVKKKVNITDSFSIFTLLILLINPTLLFQLSFQFSYLVTFSLILSRKFLASSNYFMLITKISLIAQLSLLPLQLNSFYSFNPISLLANLFFVPYFSFLVIPLSFLLAFFSSGPDFLKKPLEKTFLFFQERILEFLLFIDTHLFFEWVTGKPNIIILFLLMCFIFKLFKSFEILQLEKVIKYIFLIVCFLVFIPLMSYLIPYGRLTMIDVGQGDAMLIELPFRQGVIMIDAAGTPPFVRNQSQVANRTLIPLLKSKGITRINDLFITHLDHDHVGSVPDLINKIEINNVYMHPYVKPNHPLLILLEENSSTIHKVSAGDHLLIAGYSFFLLSPVENEKEENDRSLVIYVNLGEKSFLLTGDISSEVEEKIMKKYKGLNVDVLKIAHHGSRFSTSDQWIREFQPEVALISVGKGNWYGHPNIEVVNKLEKAGITIFRTDQHGAITYKFSKRTGTFLRYVP